MDTMKVTEWANFFLINLFEYEDKKYLDSIDKLVDENNKLLVDQSFGGFYFLNASYFKRNMPKTPSNLLPSLQASLHNQMINLLNYWNRVNMDRKIIKQLFIQMISPCKDLGEIRDTMPECLIEFSPELKRLPRMNPPGYSLRGNAPTRKNLSNMLHKIETYYASRLLY